MDRLLLDYLLDFPIAIHSRVFVLDFAGDIDFEKPHPPPLDCTHLWKSNNKGSNLKTKSQIYSFKPWDYK
jgi:hypothetical protein